MAELEDHALELPSKGTMTTDPENGQLLQSEPSSLKLDHCLEKLLSRVQSDSVYELRKLQHQYRPVSEFASKETLEQLLEKRHAVPPPPSSGIAAASATEEEAKSNVEKRVKELSAISQENAAADSPQVRMPVPVRLEIRGLFERRPVSGFLNSSHASDIERTLRDGLNRHRRRQQRRRPHPRPYQGRGGDEREDSIAAARVRGHPGAGPRPMPRRQISSSLPRPQRPENGQYRVRQRDKNSILSQLRQSPALNSLKPAERDRVLTEVGSLVQQQLVTSALSGEFRGVLELHIQNRADQIRDGMTGETIVGALQRRQEHSAMSHSARNYDPYTDEPSSASMAEMKQEIREIKTQLLDLKLMMRTSLDLQLEVQRAIRQEVAAALNSACAISTLPSPSIPPGLGVSSASSANMQAVNSGNCAICSEANIDSVMYRCGHMCVCMPCGLELKSQGLKCPICRAPITDVIRAYTSMQ